MVGNIKPTGKRTLVSVDEAVRRVQAVKSEKTPAEKALENFSWPYEHLEIEINASQELLTFDESLERIKANGFERHLTPKEYFGMIMAHLECSGVMKLDPLSNAIAKDLFGAESCWLQMLWEKKGASLKCIHDWRVPIVYDKENNFYKFTEKPSASTIFPLEEHQIGNNILLHELYAKDDEFCKFFFGRKYEEWPEEMKGMEILSPRTWIPQEDLFSPIAYSRSPARSNIIEVSLYKRARSRGVRVKR